MIANNGGDLVALALREHSVTQIFTLCGGHISPILTGCEKVGISVYDVRKEDTAVFAADANFRFTGIPGIAAVTAGPGLTNTLTALKNAQMAHSPLLLFSGAAATILKGRGSLQDIDQIRIVKPFTKAQFRVTRTKDIVGTISEAFFVSQSGVPGPVFIELPIDLLYPENIVREWYLKDSKNAKSITSKVFNWYLRNHLNKMYVNTNYKPDIDVLPIEYKVASRSDVQKSQELINAANKPVLIIGSQIINNRNLVNQIKDLVEELGIPVYLSGSARGILGREHPLQFRHKRSKALREADLILLLGVPMDFRLNYGRSLNRKSPLIIVNLSRDDLNLNNNFKKPTLKILADPASYLKQISKKPTKEYVEWVEKLQANEKERIQQIEGFADISYNKTNPIRLFMELETLLPEQTIFVGDGGDFLATGSYILKPRLPRGWIDPGVFGTLGGGAGFALAAQICNPEKKVVILYGDGASGYSLIEYDSFVRHNLPILGIVGNDAGWTQIERDQIEILESDVGTVLNHSAYEKVSIALGGEGELISSDEDLVQLSKYIANSKPRLLNVILAKTEFRKGSISM